MTSPNSPQHCCARMAYDLAQQCDLHPDPFGCPDRLIFYSPEEGTYGLIIHDGGASYISIRYCPWCGTKLPDDPDEEPPEE